MRRASFWLPRPGRGSRVAPATRRGPATDVPRGGLRFLALIHLLHLSRAICRAACFEQELGAIAACQAAGLQFNIASQASVPLLGNQSYFSLGRGAPSGAATAFSRISAFPERYCYSISGS